MSEPLKEDIDFKSFLYALETVKDTQHGDVENVYRVRATLGNKSPVRIGELFGCAVYADPYLPDDATVIIQSKSDYERNINQSINGNKEV